MADGARNNPENRRVNISSCQAQMEPQLELQTCRHLLQVISREFWCFWFLFSDLKSTPAEVVFNQRAIAALADSAWTRTTTVLLQSTCFQENAAVHLLSLLILFPSTSQALCYLGQWSAVLINFPNTGAPRQSSNTSGTVGEWTQQ